MVSVRDSYIAEDFEMSTDKGFMVALGISAYDNEQLYIEDDSYGKVNAYYKTWGLAEDQFEEIPSKPCTRAQLGLLDEEGDSESDYSKPPLFYKAHK